jgi:uroporphyrinogen-III synthase
MKQVLQNLAAFDWIVFTSPTAVRHFGTIANKLGVLHATTPIPMIAAIGDQTAREIIGLGLSVAFRPSKPTASTLAKELEIAKNKRVLLLQSTLAADDVAGILTRRMAAVTNIPIYQTKPVIEHDLAFEELLTTGQIGHIIFSSPSAVDGFATRMHAIALAIALNLPALAIGATTARTLGTRGFKDIRIAQEPTPEAIANLIL